MTELSKILRYADVDFRISSDDDDLIRALESMFLPADGDRLSREIACSPLIIEAQLEPMVTETDDLSTRQLYAAARVINNLYSQREKCLWLDAACLISDNQGLVLIAGPSCSGKTTLSLAMAFAYGWRVVAEDKVLIDPATNTVLITAAASGVRSGTVQRLQKFAGAPSDSLSPHSAWLFDENLFAQVAPAASFDLAVVVHPITDEHAVLSVSPIAHADFVRQVLSCSNLVRSDLIDTFAQTVRSARCFSLTGGELDQRMKFLRDAVSNDLNAEAGK